MDPGRLAVGGKTTVDEQAMARTAMKGVTDICRRATQCRSCFADLSIKPTDGDMAQPRWIGPGYFTAKQRVVCVLINPGKGGSVTTSSAIEGRAHLRAFSQGHCDLKPIFDHQRRSIPTWGRGKMLAFYTRGLGLDLDAIALANIAWCSTADNKYPDPMLLRCFQEHTLPLLLELEPNAVVLSGSKTHAFALHIKAALPGASVIGTLHYAHRKGYESEKAELERVRGLLGGSTTS